jgi:hypothetical protein
MIIVQIVVFWVVGLRNQLSIRMPIHLKQFLILKISTLIWR